MSVFPKELVQNIAEAININLKDETALLLLQDTEYRIREVIHVSFGLSRNLVNSKLEPRDSDCCHVILMLPSMSRMSSLFMALWAILRFAQLPICNSRFITWMIRSMIWISC
jgi:hypothetical protein